MSVSQTIAPSTEAIWHNFSQVRESVSALGGTPAMHDKLEEMQQALGQGNYARVSLIAYQIQQMVGEGDDWNRKWVRLGLSSIIQQLWITAA